MMVEDIMVRSVITIEVGANVAEAAAKMREHGVGCLIVIDAEKNIVGIVTDRDIAVRVVADNLDPKRTKVTQCMTRDIVTAIPQMDILEAAKVMNRYKIRRLPIVEGRSIIGIVSIADIAIYGECILGEVSQMRKR